MVQLKAIPGQKIPVYPDLPGHKIGAHDSLQLNDLAEDQKPEMKNITWWHHADRPRDRDIPTGALCSVALERHYISVGDINALEKGATIYPSAWCAACGRHIWIRYRGAADIHGNRRHEGAKKREVAIAAEENENKEHHGHRCQGKGRVRSVDCTGKKSYYAKSCRACFNYHRRR